MWLRRDLRRVPASDQDHLRRLHRILLDQLHLFCRGSPIVSHRVDPLLQDLRSVLLEICFDNPNRNYMVSPPMYRAHPVWYREGLPEILTMFSQSMSLDRPPNLHILPSFATPEFCSDGVSLTAYSGLEFILHLFDASQDLLSRLDSSLEQICSRSGENTRVLEDRVMALEQDHRRLNRVFESKSASDAELADFHCNERYEDSFVITGLAPISDLVGKAWQDKAVKDVQGALVLSWVGSSRSSLSRTLPAVPRTPRFHTTFSSQMSTSPVRFAVRLVLLRGKGQPSRVPSSC